MTGESGAGGEFDAEKVRRGVRLILEGVGEDPDREGVMETPERVTEMYREVLAGIGRDPTDELTVVKGAGHDEMIMVRDIPLYSLCEHHLTPFSGRAHVAYIPNEDGRITGLSKIARVVDLLAKRLQVQERLTTQIAQTLNEVLQPRGVAVVIEALHLCMLMRGVEKQNSKAVTSAMLGAFRDRPETRAEFMELIKSRGGLIL